MSFEGLIIKKRLYRMEDISSGLSKLKLAVNSAQAKLALNNQEEPPKVKKQVEEKLPKKPTEEKAAKKVEKVDKKKEEKKEENAGKSKAELRAERRAIQEAQRAAKESSKNQKKPKEDPKTPQQKPAAVQKPKTGETSSKQTKSSTKIPGQEGKVEPTAKYGSARREGLIGPFRFPHLALPADEDEIFGELRYVGTNIHPSVIQCGLQSVRGVLRESSVRGLSLINILHELVSDFDPPAGKEFKRDFDNLVLKPNLAFLGRCRPLSLSMRNIVENFRHAVSHVGAEICDFEARKRLREHLEEAGRVILAARCEIEETAFVKIQNDDVIIIYGYDSLVISVLDFAFKEGKTFKVLIVDSSPDFDAQLALEELSAVGITCGYCLINALQPSLTTLGATKVMLGAEAVMNNGAVVARIGSCQVAHVASVANVPVLVLCETFKFCDTVQTDSFHFNELGPENVMLESSPVENFKKRALLSNPTSSSSNEVPNIEGGDSSGLSSAFKVRMLNLKYDVMPGEFVTALVTEMGILPPSSVPVINRETFLRR